MSRVAKQNLKISSSITLTVFEEKIICKGPFGEVIVDFPNAFELEINQDFCRVIKKNESTPNALWGTVVSNLKNAISGVTKEFEQKLTFVGVGYKAIKKDNDLEIHLGYSHPILFKAVEGVKVELTKPNELILKSHNKQLLGDICSKLEKLRKVEPYKGKGVVKEGKYYLRKEGKKK